MITYVPLHIHSSLGSLLDGYAKPKDIVKRAIELGCPAVGISDHGSCSSHVRMYDECLKQSKEGKKIKCILGIEFYFAFEQASLKLNRDHTHGVCWAKNSAGLKSLWKASSYANEPDIYYYKPRLNLRNWKDPNSGKIYYGIEEFCREGNIESFSGHQGSFLADFLFSSNLFKDPEKRKQEIKKAYSTYKTSDKEFYDNLRQPNWLEDTCKLALELQDIFGKGNFWIELQNELYEDDRLPMWIHPTIVDSLRIVSKETGIPCAASQDSHYVLKEDAKFQRAMLQINLKETNETVEAKLSDSDKIDVMPFFGSDSFYIHTPEELATKFTKEEIENTLKIGNGIEDYNILKKPSVPKFAVPEFDSEEEYLKDCPTKSDKFLMHLAIKGAKELKPWIKNKKHTKKDYWDRLKHETNIIFKANLSDYLLTVWDFLSFCDYCPSDGSFDWMINLKNGGSINPIIRGPGRGSVGGSIACYFLKIHRIDSVKYQCIFSRFFNESRLNDLMDIDSDLQPERRQEVISFLEYRLGGQDKIGQISTYGKIQGKSSIRDIMRINGIKNHFDIAGKICEYIPDESKIIDQIQEMRDAGNEDYGILNWALDNSEELREYQKEYKEIFDIALKIESTPRNASRHASGWILTPEGTISESYPMVLDNKNKKKIIGFTMNDAAKCGGVKIDLLGLNLLSKLSDAEKMINANR